MTRTYIARSLIRGEGPTGRVVPGETFETENDLDALLGVHVDLPEGVVREPAPEFPIKGYGNMTARDIVKTLRHSEFTTDELLHIHARESDRERPRKTVLDQIDRELD